MGRFSVPPTGQCPMTEALSYSTLISRCERVAIGDLAWSDLLRDAARWTGSDAIGFADLFPRHARATSPPPAGHREPPSPRAQRRRHLILPLLREAARYSLVRFEPKPAPAPAGRAHSEALCLLDARHVLTPIDGEPARLVRDTPVRIVAGRLTSAKPPLARAINGALQMARAGRPSRFRLRTARQVAVQFRFAPYRGPMPSGVSATASVENGPAENGLAVLRLIARPDDRTEGVALFSAAFGLSAREGELVEQLLTAPTSRDAAATLGIRYETLRWHLKNIYAKTNCGGRDALLDAVRSNDLTAAL